MPVKQLGHIPLESPQQDIAVGIISEIHSPVVVVAREYLPPLRQAP